MLEKALKAAFLLAKMNISTWLLKKREYDIANQNGLKA